MIGMKFKVMSDPKAVVDAIDRATDRNMRTFGRYTRQTVRQSIRKRKAASLPGQPPSSHRGDLKRLIYYDYEQDAQNVVIGPLKYNQVVFDESLRPVSQTVPEILETGGDLWLVEEWNGYVWRRRDLRTRRSAAAVAAVRNSGHSGVFVQKRPHRKRRVRIAARPFMQPAFELNQQELPKIWANSVR